MESNAPQDVDKEEIELLVAAEQLVVCLTHTDGCGAVEHDGKKCVVVSKANGGGWVKVRLDESEKEIVNWRNGHWFEVTKDKLSLSEAEQIHVELTYSDRCGAVEHDGKKAVVISKANGGGWVKVRLDESEKETMNWRNGHWFELINDKLSLSEAEQIHVELTHSDRCGAVEHDGKKVVVVSKANEGGWVKVRLDESVQEIVNWRNGHWFEVTKDMLSLSEAEQIHVELTYSDRCGALEHDGKKAVVISKANRGGWVKVRLDASEKEILNWRNGHWFPVIEEEVTPKFCVQLKKGREVGENHGCGIENSKHDGKKGTVISESNAGGWVQLKLNDGGAVINWQNNHWDVL